MHGPLKVIFVNYWQFHFPASLPLQQQGPIHAVGSTLGSSVSVGAVAEEQYLSLPGTTLQFSRCSRKA
jgi:hypothetical protein